MFITQTVLVTTTPLRIGAFNLQIYGQTKSSMNSTVSIIGQVSGDGTYTVLLLYDIIIIIPCIQNSSIYTLSRYSRTCKADEEYVPITH